MHQAQRDESADASPKNDDRLELQYGGAFGVPRNRKDGTDEAFEILRGNGLSAPTKNPAHIGVCPASVPLCPTYGLEYNAGDQKSWNAGLPRFHDALAAA